MKNKFALLLLSLLVSSGLLAQSFSSNLHAILKKDFGPFKEGQEILITKIGMEQDFEYSEDSGEGASFGTANEPTTYSFKSCYCLTIDNQLVPLKQKEPSKIFDFKAQNIQDLWDAGIISNVLYNLKERGMQNKLRAEMEQDALEYISQLRSYDLILNDPFLELYLYSLITKLVPENIVDGRPGNVNVVVVQDPSMNAAMFPNGTMVINTGLLARIHSEDELVAIMSHEIAHFMLDHSVININKATDRQKRADFWGAVLTGITAVAEGYAASQNPYYVPGAATVAVAAASRAIASEINNRLGMEYNHEQEYEADAMACEMLKLVGYDSNALASVFSRIAGEQQKERSNISYFDSYDHPALVSRISKVGTPTLLQDQLEYEKYVSFAVSSAAQMKYEDRRFKQALELVTQNVENGVATSDDYLIRANCLMALYNTTEINTEAMNMISMAKDLNASNINIYKAEIVCNLRMKNTDVAVAQLKSYTEALKQMTNNSRWEEEALFARNETIWANNMLSKLRGL